MLLLFFTMVDQITSAEICRSCGALLEDDKYRSDGLCGNCATASSSLVLGNYQEQIPAPAPFDQTAALHQEALPDPDNPRWGPLAGISIWLVSVAAITVIPVIAVASWLLILWARGAPLPDFAVKEQIEQWVMSPNILLLQIISTIVAHAVTLAACWVVVTRVGSRPFWTSLGWHWGGRPIWHWLVLSGCILIVVQLASQVLLRFLPEADSPFAQLLRSSQQVRIAVALLATFTAPLTEEVVYRGVLFASLRKRTGLIVTVLVVTVTFAGVHVLQNWGAWVSISGLTLLSLALTIVRARTKSILPSVFIHTVNNAFASVLILLNKGA